MPVLEYVDYVVRANKMHVYTSHVWFIHFRRFAVWRVYVDYVARADKTQANTSSAWFINSGYFHHRVV